MVTMLAKSTNIIKPRKSETLAISLGIIISISLALYAKVIEYFVVSPYTLSNYILVEGHIPFKLFDSNDYWSSHANTFVNYPATAIIISFLSMILGIDAYLIVYLPINAVILSVILLLFLHMYCPHKSCKVTYTIFSLFPIYIVARQPFTWNLTYHSLGFVSHLIAFYLVVKKLYFREKMEDNLALLLVFSLSLLSYYTASSYTIVSILAIMLWLMLIGIRGYINAIKQLKQILIMMLFSYIFYDFAVWNVINNWRFDFSTLIDYLLTFIHRFMSGLPPSEELYPFGLPFERSLFDILLSRIATIFSLSSPIAVLVLALLNDVRSNENEKLKEVVIILSSLTVALSEVIFYVIAGYGLNLRYLHVFTPIVTLSILNKVCQSVSSYRKVICLAIAALFTVATVGVAKLHLYNSVIEGLGTWKKDLVQLPEYEFFAEYSCCGMTLYSNFQVSAEVRMMLIRTNKVEEVTSKPFLDLAFKLYDIARRNNIADLISLDRSVIILTRLDLTKPVYGSAWGHATPPFSEQIVDIFDKSELLNRIYSSERIYAYGILVKGYH